MNAIDGDKLDVILDKILQLSTDLDEKNSAGAVDLLKAIAKSGLLNCTPEPPPTTPEPVERNPVAWVWRLSDGCCNGTLKTVEPLVPTNCYVAGERDGWCPVYE